MCPWLGLIFQPPCTLAFSPLLCQLLHGGLLEAGGKAFGGKESRIPGIGCCGLCGRSVCSFHAFSMSLLEGGWSHCGGHSLCSTFSTLPLLPHMSPSDHFSQTDCWSSGAVPLISKSPALAKLHPLLGDQSSSRYVQPFDIVAGQLHTHKVTLG